MKKCYRLVYYIDGKVNYSTPMSFEEVLELKRLLPEATGAYIERVIGG